MDNNSSNLIAVAEWNSNLARVLIPNDIILSLYILLGITGNLTVIFVYHFRMKKKSDDRYFIPVLAVADLAGSTVCASFGIALNMMQAEFYNDRLCKAWWFFAAFTTFTSILLLLIIATQRFLKVCRPIGKQMTLFHKRLAIGLAVGLAIVLAIPTTLLYGSVDFPNADGSIIGKRCSKLKTVSKAGALTYGVIIVLVCLTSMTAMIYFYIRIGLKLYKHFKYASPFKSHRRNSYVEQLQSTTDSNLPGKDTVTSETTLSTGDNIVQEQTKTDQPSSQTDKPTKERQKATKNFKKKDHENKNRKIMNKITFMFMLITTIFIICYIPKVTLMVIEGLNPKFWEIFSDSERAGVLFLYRSYIINNVINPFIYAFMDLEFRKETKAFITCSQ